MRLNGFVHCAAVVVCVTLLSACDCKRTETKASPAEGTTQGQVASVEINEAMLAAFAPLPDVMVSETNPLTPQKIELGRRLYYETRLSKAADVSCNTCHLLDEYGVDHRRVSRGHAGQEGTRNAPTVYNAAGHVAQFWDGRAPTVEEQAKGPILNPVEMAMQSEEEVLRLLKSLPDYVESFTAAFPQDERPLTYDNLGKAIGAFERKLLTPSPWDHFLEGNRDALTEAQKVGFNDFVASGCMTCHSGPYVGGTMFQKLGLIKPWPNQDDLGRFEVTKQEADRMVFKVPSLRNVEKTAPYFHDGSVDSLQEAVRLMARHQVGRELSDQTIASIVAWLHSLTGALPVDYVAHPQPSQP